MAQLPPPPRPYGAARRFQVLEAAFDLYRRCFVPFLLMAAVIMIPLSLAESYLTLEVFPQLVTEVNGEVVVDDEVFWRAFTGLMITALVAMLATQLLTGALTRAAVVGVAEGRPSAGATFRFALRRVHSLLWISLLTGLLVAGGVLLLVVPGIIALVRSLLAMPVFVLEGSRGSKAIRRSFQLTKGEGWMVFGIYVIAVVVTIVVSALFAAPFGDQWLAQGLATGLAGALTQPFLASVIVFMYLDLRARREGLDRDGLAAELTGQGPEPVPPGLPQPDQRPPDPFG